MFLPSAFLLQCSTLMGPQDIFLALLACSGFFYLMGTVLLIRYHLRSRQAPDLESPVTVLKPLAGKIPDLESALQSFMSQTHARLQILFGVGSADDPAREVAESLMSRFPQVDAKLVVAGPPIGPNRKVNSLYYMLEHAKYDLLMICDDDVFVPGDFVSRMAGEMKDPRVGLATATYYADPRNAALAMHSLTMATEFFPSVVSAEALEGGLSFSLGPASILRRKLLSDIGGFEHLSNFLAEDYLLGALGREKGWKIVLSREQVRIGDNFQSFFDMLGHQLRWSRTYRACRPGGFFLSILTQGVFFAAVYLAVGRGDFVSLAGAGSLLGLRMLASAVQIGLRGPGRLFLWWIFVPIRDLMSVVFWALSFLGNKVRWRENVYRLAARGRLEPLS